MSEDNLDRLTAVTVSELLTDDVGRPVSLWEVLDRREGRIREPMLERLDASVCELHLTYDGVRVVRHLREQVKERKDEARELKSDLLSRMAETRQDVRDLRDRQDKTDERHADALRRVVESLPQTYVDREDYIRSTAAQDKKLDRLLSGILEVQRGQQAHVAKEDQ